MSSRLHIRMVACENIEKLREFVKSNEVVALPCAVAKIGNESCHLARGGLSGLKAVGESNVCGKRYSCAGLFGGSK